MLSQQQHLHKAVLRQPQQLSRPRAGQTAAKRRTWYPIDGANQSSTRTQSNPLSTRCGPSTTMVASLASRHTLATLHTQTSLLRVAPTAELEGKMRHSAKCADGNEARTDNGTHNNTGVHCMHILHYFMSDRRYLIRPGPTTLYLH